MKLEQGVKVKFTKNKAILAKLVYFILLNFFLNGTKIIIYIKTVKPTLFLPLIKRVAPNLLGLRAGP